MEEVIVYSTTSCPLCVRLKDKLKEKNISFEERNELTHLEEMRENNIRQVPVLVTPEGDFLATFKAMTWVNNHE